MSRIATQYHMRRTHVDLRTLRKYLLPGLISCAVVGSLLYLVKMFDEPDTAIAIRNMPAAEKREAPVSPALIEPEQKPLAEKLATGADIQKNVSRPGLGGLLAKITVAKDLNWVQPEPNKSDDQAVAVKIDELEMPATRKTRRFLINRTPVEAKILNFYGTRTSKVSKVALEDTAGRKRTFSLANFSEADRDYVRKKSEGAALGEMITLWQKIDWNDSIYEIITRFREKGISGEIEYHEQVMPIGIATVPMTISSRKKRIDWVDNLAEFRDLMKALIKKRVESSPSAISEEPVTQFGGYATLRSGEVIIEGASFQLMAEFRFNLGTCALAPNLSNRQCQEILGCDGYLPVRLTKFMLLPTDDDQQKALEAVVAIATPFQEKFADFLQDDNGYAVFYCDGPRTFSVSRDGIVWESLDWPFNHAVAEKLEQTEPERQAKEAELREKTVDLTNTFTSK